MTELDPAVEQRISEISAQDFAALVARTRPPTSTQQLKDIAGKVLSGPQLDAFVAMANPKAFAGDNGDVDESKVMGHLTAMYGDANPGNGPQPRAAHEIARQRQRLGIDQQQSTHAERTEIRVQTSEKPRLPGGNQNPANHPGPPPRTERPNAAAEVAHQRQRLGLETK